MNEEFVELVKNSMKNKSDYIGLERAYITEEGTTFLGYALKLNGGNLLLFISDTENCRLLHDGYSVFGFSVFRDRCLWIGDEDIVHICGGMLI